MISSMLGDASWLKQTELIILATCFQINYLNVDPVYDNLKVIIISTSF